MGAMKGLAGRTRKDNKEEELRDPVDEIEMKEALPKKHKRDVSQLQERFNLKVGRTVVGRVDLKTKFPVRAGYIAIRLAPSLHGMLCITHLGTNELSELKHNQFVKCVILRPLSKTSRNPIPIEVSMRNDLINASDVLKESLLDDEYNSSLSLPAVGQLVKGFVASVTNKGCFVKITRANTAFVNLRDLADEFVQNVEESFPVGKHVAGRVVLVDEKLKHVNLSLRSTAVIGQNDAKWTWETINVGLSLPGKVRRCEKYGVFINIDDSNNLVGLCHRSKMFDHVNLVDVSKEYSPGDKVKVKVLDVDIDKRRLSLGLAPSLFELEDESSEDESIDASKKKTDDESEEEVIESDVNRKISVMEESSKINSQSNSHVGTTSRVLGPTVKLSAGDMHLQQDDIREIEGPMISLQDVVKSGQLDLKLRQEGIDSSDSEEEDEQQQQPNKSASSSKKRARKRRREEAEISAKEEALMANENTFESVEDYERALISAPNSSMLWIQYMSFQIALTEIDQARRIAERALKSINFREEEEKRNVWQAYLKLEFQFGEKEKLEKVFNRMLPEWNPKHAYYALAKIYADGNQIDNADQTLKRAVKVSKGQSKGAWLRRIELYMDNDRVDEARSLLQSAMRALPKRKQTMTIVKFARFEFMKPSGNPERARTAFEGLIDSYPKRTDIWHLYIDAEIKHGKDSIQRVRKLFERVTTLKLSVKKMKSFFKKWLAFENEKGDPEAAETVKAKAREFVKAVAES